MEDVAEDVISRVMPPPLSDTFREPNFFFFPEDKKDFYCDNGPKTHENQAVFFCRFIY